MTEAISNQLKHKYQGVELWHVTVRGDTEGEELDYVLRAPDRKTMSAVARIGQDDPFAASELMVRQCVVHGDETQLDNLRVFGALAKHFEMLTKERESTIKKL
jgi:hypothetical protein